MPHVYCAFADGGTPYESYSFAIAPGDSYDYLLKPENQITPAAKA
jgi:hypothetical protein